MNNLNYLTKLLNGASVTWKPLGEVATYIRGVTYNKHDESAANDGYKILRANNITQSNNLINFSDIKFINFDAKVKDNQKLYKNDILISSASGSREHVGKIAFIYNDIDYYFGGFMGVLRTHQSILSKFLFYILSSDIFQQYLDKFLNSSTINNISSEMINSFKIPIPCAEDVAKSLQIQGEIVRILDTFTKHTTELTTELTYRKKQYNYYLNKLLTFAPNTVPYKPLGEVTYWDKRFNGVDKLLQPKVLKFKHISAEKLKSININNGDIRLLSTGNFIGYTNNELAGDCINTGEVITIPTGGTANIKYYKGSFVDSGNLLATARENINTKYIYYFLIKNNALIQSFFRGSGVQHPDMRAILDIKIPIPPLAEQQRIVNILDKFNTIATSLTQGLPYEIALRKKQYNYYLNLLLNFKK